MVRGFLGHVGGENHFLQFSFMRSDEAKKCFKKIFFFKVALNLFHDSSHFQTNEPIKKNFVVRNLT